MRCSLVLVFVLWCGCSHARLVEEVISVPVTVKTIYNQTVSQDIQVTTWRDDTRSKAPFLVINHGRPAKSAMFAQMQRQRYSPNSAYFVARGFAVLVPTRVGYGPSGGPDVEYSGTCQSRMYPAAFKAAADQTLALLSYARQNLPYIDTSRGLIVGQSFGGATAIALAASNVEGAAGAVNFAGGSGGNPETSPERPCRPDQLERTFADYGRASGIPTLWLYSENDQYFGKIYPRRWFDAFVAAGGRGTFVTLPAFKSDGHGTFTANPGVWKPAFEEYLKAIGF